MHKCSWLPELASVTCQPATARGRAILLRRYLLNVKKNYNTSYPVSLSAPPHTAVCHL